MMTQSSWSYEQKQETELVDSVERERSANTDHFGHVGIYTAETGNSVVLRTG